MYDLSKIYGNALAGHAKKGWIVLIDAFFTYFALSLAFLQKPLGTSGSPPIFARTMTSAVLRPEMEDRGRYRREPTTNRALECSSYPV